MRETPAEQPKKETRRARPERGFSMDGAIQEPEGGLDLTLAAARQGNTAYLVMTGAGGIVELQLPGPARNRANCRHASG